MPTDLSHKTKLDSGEKTTAGENGVIGDSQTLAALCMSSTETAVSLKEENKIETMEPSKLEKVAKSEAKEDGKLSKKRVRLSREVNRVLEDHF